MGNMKKMMKKIVLFLLCAVLLVQSAGCMCAPSEAAMLAYLALTSEQPEPTAVPLPVQPVEPLPMPDGNETPKPAEPGAEPEPVQPAAEPASPAHPEIKFKDIEYERPDTQLIRDAVTKLFNDVENAGPSSADALMEQYDAILQMYGHIDTQYAVAYILHSMDVSDEFYQKENEYLEGELNEIDLDMTKISVTLIESPVTAEAFREKYGDQYIRQVYEGEKLNADEIQSDLKKDSELVTKYDDLLTHYAVSYGGRSYTFDDISAMEDQDLQYVLYQQYIAELNTEAGGIFLQMLAVRDHISKTLGFDNFAEYRYANYGRDYSLEDIAKVRAAAKETLAPLYSKTFLKMYYLNDFTGATKNDRFVFSTFMNQFQGKLRELMPGAETAFNYMLRNGLYDVTVNPHKMETSYTIRMSDYNAPFIFSQWEEKAQSAKTIIHEFGHFFNYYESDLHPWNSGDSLDLAEVDSQTLEMLMTHEYPTFFGGHADLYEAEQYVDAMYAVLTGLMEDEFQEIVYKNPGMTLEQMNETYGQLAQEYGQIFTAGNYWTLIPHTFQSPMYYVSYAVSMILSLQIWELGERDYQKARETYLSILHRPEYSALRETAQVNGLADPISGETIRSITAALDAKLTELMH